MQYKNLENIVELEPGTRAYDAFTALKDRDYQKALELYEPLALNGSRSAMLAVGVLHDNDEIPELLDSSASVVWYEKAFEQESAEAARMLGRMYYLGRGVPIDYKKAIFYYEWLAERSYPIALYRLARINRNGQGVKKDFGKALEYYSKAVKEGHVFARKELGIIKIKRGNILSGAWLYATAFVTGVFLMVHAQDSARLHFF